MESESVSLLTQYETIYSDNITSIRQLNSCKYATTEMISIISVLSVISIVTANIQEKYIHKFDESTDLWPWSKRRICNNTELSVCLCGGEEVNSLSDTILVLLPRIVYSFSSHGPCIIKQLKNFKLVGEHGIANVKCSRNASGVILFRNVENLEITNINFSDCGSVIPDNFLISNFTKPGQQAVVYISYSKSLVLRNVNISNYRGFALLVAEIHHTVIDNIEVSFTKCCANEVEISCSCSGIVAYYNAQLSNSEIDFTLQNSRFYYNYNAYSSTREIFCDMRIDKQLPVSASFTLIISQANINKITINNNKFVNNFGITGAGIIVALITNYNIPKLPLSIENNYFQRNYLVDLRQPCIGSAIEIKLVSYHRTTSNIIEAIPIVTIDMNNNTVTKHTKKSAIAISSFGYMKVTVNVTGLRCNYNSPLYNGICLTAKVQQSLDVNQRSGTFEMHLENIEAKGNIIWIGKKKHETVLTAAKMTTRPSLFLFVNIPYVVIRGSPGNLCYFYSNDAPIIVSVQSRITLAGRIKIEDLLVSTAFYLIDSSYLTLLRNTNILFTGKYVNHTGEALIDVSSNTIESLCALQLDIDPQCSAQYIRDSYNITTFNKSVLHLLPAYNCVLHSNMPNCHINTEDIYNCVFGDTVVRSNPVGVYYFENGQPVTGNVRVALEVYPGNSFSICIALMDYAGNIIPGAILIELYSKENTHGKKTIHFSDNEASLVETSYADYNTCRKYKLQVDNNERNVARGNLIISETGMQSSLIVDITVRECPNGFMLASGKCTCSRFMMAIQKRLNNAHIECYIQRKAGKNKYSTILKIKSCFWLGIGNKATVKRADKHYSSNNSISMLYTGICPLGYCNYTKDYTDLTIDNDMCVGNRKGQVCSECKDGHSAVFGSTNCQKCSNVWLWTIPAYMLLGIILVFLLLLLQLTINHGEVTSIVLYSNIAIFGLSYMKRIYPDFASHESTILSLIDFNTEYPLCLYDGMTDTAKTALQFAFPVYTWLLVIIVIIMSRNSTLITNRIADRSVQVLITIFHLSYTKVLITTVEILTPLKVVVENVEANDAVVTHLWNVNPSIPYGSTWEHMVLIIVAIGFLVLLVVPYLALSLFVPFCWHRRFVIRFRPVFETMYGPYKQECSYWFGIRVLVLTIFAVVSTTMQGANIYTELLIFQLVLLLLIIAQAFVNPFKNKLVSVIDLYCLTNITFLYILGTFQALRNLLDTGITRITIVVMYFTILLLTFGILIYHTLKYVSPINRKLRSLCHVLDNKYPALKLSEKFHGNKTEYQTLEDDSNTVLREPLLQ